MHLLDRCGQITGTREVLARLGRCTSVQVESALADLMQTKAADVTERNGAVTVTNRRMKKEYQARKQGAERVGRYREKQECNGAVTPYNQNQTQNYNQPKVIEHQLSQGAAGENVPIRKDLTKLTLEIPMCGRIAKEILTNKTGCFYDNCKVKAEEINARSLQTTLEEFDGKVSVTEALQCWNEAVIRTHQAVVDEMDVKNIPAYCIGTFRDLLNPKK